MEFLNTDQNNESRVIIERSQTTIKDIFNRGPDTNQLLNHNQTPNQKNTLFLSTRKLPPKSY